MNLKNWSLRWVMRGRLIAQHAKATTPSENKRLSPPRRRHHSRRPTARRLQHEDRVTARRDRAQRLTPIKPSQPAMTQPDLFSAVSIALPDEAELRRRFRAFNDEFFDGALPDAKVRWSNRMRIAGTCNHVQRIISLSRPYHEHFPHDVDDTLKHEMIHLIHHGHDAVFKREAERVGASVHCREYPGLHPRARIVYLCPGCDAVFHRTRKERLFCGKCSRGRHDTRFELVLRPPATQQAARRPRRILTNARPRRSLRDDWAAGDLFN
jgi:predicted SprT family Zn-dependent metalloprotease